MASADMSRTRAWLTRLGSSLTGLGSRLEPSLTVFGDWSLFAGQTLQWTIRRRPARGTFVQACYDVGVRSVGVILITGTFIGMVLAVQSYAQFHNLGLESRLGTIINTSVIRELGPVLAATMLAGRVGSAMAAEMATMRITEQIDALSCLGANPVHYLVVPRLLACVFVIPLLTIMADFMGIVGGAFISLNLYHIDAHGYWLHSSRFVGMWDLQVGLVKSVFFGAAITLISCHRGFNSKPGSEGVGRAATEAFVASFIAILALDLFIAMGANSLYDSLWPDGKSKGF